MKIELMEIIVKDVTDGYVDNSEDGVLGYGGKLNIRPKYQREFIYKLHQRVAVIDSITKNFPLNVMYWIKTDEGNYEILDGQQRTVSICQYINDDFPVENLLFSNLTNTEKNHILNYRLMIYVCEGNDKEVLDWFKIINTAGEKLTEQESRNAVYTGPWLSEAKRIFSKTGCSAYKLAQNYVNGTPIRQDYLETAIKWINKGNIEEYMSIHQHDPNANEIWTYFQNVINWVKLTFPKYRSEMKGLDWGGLYDEHHKKLLDTVKLEKEIESLMIDDDVTNKKGIYSYVLNGKEKHLNIRAFTESQRRQSFEKQKGVCPKCEKTFEIKQMEADHITPWSKGGKTSVDNCQMLCKECNRRKSGA